MPWTRCCKCANGLDEEHNDPDGDQPVSGGPSTAAGVGSLGCITHKADGLNDDRRCREALARLLQSRGCTAGTGGSWTCRPQSPADKAWPTMPRPKSLTHKAPPTKPGPSSPGHKAWPTKPRPQSLSRAADVGGPWPLRPQTLGRPQVQEGLGHIAHKASPTKLRPQRIGCAVGCGRRPGGEDHPSRFHLRPILEPAEYCSSTGSL